jgi:hypothetical protein
VISNQKLVGTDWRGLGVGKESTEWKIKGKMILGKGEESLVRAGFGKKRMTVEKCECQDLQGDRK